MSELGFIAAYLVMTGLCVGITWAIAPDDEKISASSFVALTWPVVVPATLVILLIVVPAIATNTIIRWVKQRKVMKPVVPDPASTEPHNDKR